jgi:hypothetical protein
VRCVYDGESSLSFITVSCDNIYPLRPFVSQLEALRTRLLQAVPQNHLVLQTSLPTITISYKFLPQHRPPT